MNSKNDVEYHDELVAVLETVWGDGFLSPGGPTEVAMVLEGTDISEKQVLDKAALFKDVFRVLKPEGIFVASDWMRCDANPPSEEMQNYIRTEGLSFDMAPSKNYAAALQEAGFENIMLRDRNPWYAELGRNEYEQMKGPLYQTLVERAGQSETDRCIEVWRTMCVVLDSGELRPGHMKAVKPNICT